MFWIWGGTYPGPFAQKLRALAQSVPARISSLRDAERAIPASVLVLGLEQGLRELPGMLASIDAAWRPACAKALHAAIAAHYPDFVDKDWRRLEKVFTRGRIRTDSEYYLLRYHVDAREGEDGEVCDLGNLYRLLAEYEVRQ